MKENPIRVTLLDANLVSSDQDDRFVCLLKFGLSPEPTTEWLEDFIYLKDGHLEAIRQKRIESAEIDPETYSETPWEISLVSKEGSFIEAVCDPDDKERLCQLLKKIVVRVSADYPKRLESQKKEEAYRRSFQKQIEDLKKVFNSA